MTNSPPTDDCAAAMVDAMSSGLGLAIEPAWRTDVIGHLKTIAAAARLVAEAPLDDELEPAPVFRA